MIFNKIFKQRELSQEEGYALILENLHKLTRDKQIIVLEDGCNHPKQSIALKCEAALISLRCGVSEDEMNSMFAAILG